MNVFIFNLNFGSYKLHNIFIFPITLIIFLSLVCPWNNSTFLFFPFYLHIMTAILKVHYEISIVLICFGGMFQGGKALYYYTFGLHCQMQRRYKLN